MKFLRGLVFVVMGWMFIGLVKLFYDQPALLRAVLAGPFAWVPGINFNPGVSVGLAPFVPHGSFSGFIDPAIHLGQMIATAATLFLG